MYSLKNNTKNNKKYLLLQTVGFDTPAQLNKGTSTDESDGEDHFYYLTSSVPRGFEDSSNCHLCHHNQALSPFTQLGSGNVDIPKPYVLGKKFKRKASNSFIWVMQFPFVNVSKTVKIAGNREHSLQSPFSKKSYHLVSTKGVHFL